MVDQPVGPYLRTAFWNSVLLGLNDRHPPTRRNPNFYNDTGMAIEIV